MLIYLVVILSAVAALLSWRVAASQGRNAKIWALWTFLLGGLPLILLLIQGLFALPKFSAGIKHTCCAKQSWTPVADFGHAGGVDLDLGKCDSCGEYLMAVFYVESTTYVVISKELAKRFLKLQGTPELKKVLKNWVG